MEAPQRWRKLEPRENNWLHVYGNVNVISVDGQTDKQRSEATESTSPITSHKMNVSSLTLYCILKVFLPQL